MTDSVKSIFKILFKIPIIILVCYAIFNIFAFGLSYFKLIGISYVVMQTAIENNYIPEDDRITIEDYMNTMKTGVLTNIRIIGNPGRKQYGEPVTIGVAAKYHFIWPLTHKQQTVSGVEGTTSGVAADGTNGGSTFGGWVTDEQLEYQRNKLEDLTRNMIVKYEVDGDRVYEGEIDILYNVPGLKYYPDLE